MSILGWNFVRQRGFEPPRYCYRQPLKLVRLPVPPLPHAGYECILACNLLACNHGCSQAQPSLQLTVHSSKPESRAQGSPTRERYGFFGCDGTGCELGGACCDGGCAAGCCPAGD